MTKPATKIEKIYPHGDVEMNVYAPVITRRGGKPLPSIMTFEKMLHDHTPLTILAPMTFNHKPIY